MQQAENDVTPKAPQNVLVHERPGDTLTACANVLSLLMDIKDTRQEEGLSPMSKAAEDGVSWIEMSILDAIRYEAGRA